MASELLTRLWTPQVRVGLTVLPGLALFAWSRLNRRTALATPEQRRALLAQTEEGEVEAEGSETPVLRAPGYASGLLDSVAGAHGGERVTTLYELFDASIASGPERPLLGVRRDAGGKHTGGFEWKTAAAVRDARNRAAAGLLDLVGDLVRTTAAKADADYADALQQYEAAVAAAAAAAPSGGVGATGEAAAAEATETPAETATETTTTTTTTTTAATAAAAAAPTKPKREPGAGQVNVGIYANNRPEWLEAEHAAYAASLVIVSLYDTFGEEALAYICDHASLQLVFCGTKTNTARVLAVAGKTPVRVVVQFDAIDAEQRAAAETAGVRLLAWADLLALGDQQLGKLPAADAAANHMRPQPDSLSTIMYTSGTTGMPKGVMISHRNVVACMGAVEATLSSALQRDDAYLSFLPLAHIFERVVVCFMLHSGARVGFAQGIPARFLDDVTTLQPAVIVGVPRVFERLMEGIQARVAAQPWYARLLFRLALRQRVAALRDGYDTPGWRSLVFEKIRAATFPRTRVFFSGGAPLSTHIQDFLAGCLGVAFLQGYGLTETCGGTCAQSIHEFAPGSVGAPLPCCEIKLVDVPEMGYQHSDRPAPRGEIMVRGPSVSLGYYREPQKTAEEYAGGWLHTGDIGKINANGTLSIVDRKKNLFKLKIGEYVAPERLEGLFKQSPFVSEIWIYGDSFQNAVVAVVVPNAAHLARWAAEQQLNAADKPALLRNPRLVQAILDSFRDIGKAERLQSFEVPRGVLVTEHEFSVANGLLAPSLKLKRHSLRDFFQRDIDAMYVAINAAAPPSSAGRLPAA